MKSKKHIMSEDVSSCRRDSPFFHIIPHYSTKKLICYASEHLLAIARRTLVYLCSAIVPIAACHLIYTFIFAPSFRLPTISSISETYLKHIWIDTTPFIHLTSFLILFVLWRDLLPFSVIMLCKLCFFWERGDGELLGGFGGLFFSLKILKKVSIFWVLKIKYLLYKKTSSTIQPSS